MKTSGTFRIGWSCSVSLLTVLLFCFATVAADEPREGERNESAAEEGRKEPGVAQLRQRLEKLEIEIRQLRQQGKSDAAEARLGEARELQGHLQKVRAAEGEKHAEARTRIEALKRQSQEARQAGRHDEAERLEREAREILQKVVGINAVERGDVPAEARQRLAQLKAEIAKLREAGEREKAGQLEREMQAIVNHLSGGGPSGEKGSRLRHLQAAAEHLRAAGAGELAEQVARHARELEAATSAGDKPREKPRDADKERAREGDREPKERDREEKPKQRDAEQRKERERE
jgi:hypothetical protein